ncbi:hypothetical protein KI688_010433 [Linnemannia hyalina]|uniref:Uncharacterized protein n=1 Tax=Linnemannia hyalina TaxID=64524 RepID=A0A9P7XYB8_9FUNG|nr:hypothetical protein KI688_010433 [Linnemannia hyalina]
MAHFREVTRIIASPILEQLQTLTIPVSDIKRYIGVIDQLLELENVLFILDELFVYDPSDIPTYNNDDAPTEVEEVLRTTKAREEAVMQAWVCPETVQFELLKMLRMLRAPTPIDKLNWVQFVSHVSLTDLAEVQEITVSHNQRCRSLRKVNMSTLGPGVFSWAVQEKTDWTALETVTTTRNYRITRTGPDEKWFIGPSLEDDDNDYHRYNYRHLVPRIEGPRRQRWRWDWDLPLLARLVLKSKFVITTRTRK